MTNGLLRTHSSRISFFQRGIDVFIIVSLSWSLVRWYGATWETKQIIASVLAVIFFLLFAEMRGVYRSWRTSPLVEELREITLIWMMVVFALLLLFFASKSSEQFSRVVVTTWFIGVPLMLGIVRFVVRSLLRYVRRYGVNIRTVAIVGNNPIAHRLVNHLNAMPWAGLLVNGFFENDVSVATSIVVGGKAYSLGSMDDFMRLAQSGKIDSVYIALPISKEGYIEELVNQLADTTTTVYVVPDLFVSELVHARWIDFGGMPLVSVYETPFYGLYGWIKRLEDIVLGSLILLLISPLMLAIAIAVKASSPGTIFFKQRRYGLNGSVVKVWKFRSMSVCEDGVDVPQAQKHDSRITPLGVFLRRSSLDELPQFFNVLQGTMSIVGPRPHAVAHNEQYRKLINGYMLRHKVKPGITGWAQVNGWRGETDTLDKMQKRVEYDLEYIQNWSVWLDLKIVFLTVWRGFTGKNVY